MYDPDQPVPNTPFSAGSGETPPPQPEPPGQPVPPPNAGGPSVPYVPPQHQQPVYQQPIQYVQVQSTRTNGFAIASMVLGILWIYWIGSILALIFGYIAKGQIDRAAGTQSGRGMAIAGIVLGWIGVGILILLFIVGVGVGIARP